MVTVTGWANAPLKVSVPIYFSCAGRENAVPSGSFFVRIDVKPVQPLKTEPPLEAPRLSRVSGRMTVVSLVQLWKAILSMEMSLVLDKSTVPERYLLPLKACFWIVSKLTAPVKSAAVR